jgi:ATP-dependent RNA helicase SUPV3L1/SUV3
VRVDILERLADLIRPAINYRPGLTPGGPPPGAADGDGFVVTVAMTSLAGCSGEDFASILQSLGYVSERRKGPAITVPLVPLASVEPVRPGSDAALDQQAAEAAQPESAPNGLGADQADDAAPPPAPARAESGLPGENPEQPVAPASVETIAQSGAVAPIQSASASEPPTASASSEESVPAQIAVPALELESTQPSTDQAVGTKGQSDKDPEIEVWRRPHRHHAPGRRHGERTAGRSRRSAAETAKAPSPQRVPAGVAAQGPNSGRPPDQRPGSAERPRAPRPENVRGEKRPERASPVRRNESKTAKTERERLPDPDSPFAKLLALKMELENKAKKD